MIVSRADFGEESSDGRRRLFVAFPLAPAHGRAVLAQSARAFAYANGSEPLVLSALVLRRQHLVGKCLPEVAVAPTQGGPVVSERAGVAGTAADCDKIASIGRGRLSVHTQESNRRCVPHMYDSPLDGDERLSLGWRGTAAFSLAQDHAVLAQSTRVECCGTNRANFSPSGGNSSGSSPPYPPI